MNLSAFKKTEEKWEKPEFIVMMLLVCAVKNFKKIKTLF